MTEKPVDRSLPAIQPENRPNNGPSVTGSSLTPQMLVHHADELEEPQGELPSVDLPRIEAAVREILFAVGEDADREGLLETPSRVARMYRDMFCGLHQDPRIHLEKVFTQEYDEVVLVRDISFASMCEHHLLPMIGKAHVAYAPNGKVVGLSKLARVVETIARRPQLQERITEHVAEALDTRLSPKGVAVVIEAEHSCMTIRGVNKPGALTVTSAMRGLFRHNPTSRQEVMALIYGHPAMR